jgi:pSer/pThr/pTyr-binding forkhead associated (FHA) protein
MDRSDYRPESGLPDAPRPSLGEVVIVSGRQAGMRRSLTSVVTLLGRDGQCDLRLHAEDVGAVHCAVVCLPDGIHLRDLGSPGGTLVNGRPFGAGPVAPDDLITVGPFQFRVELSAAAGEEPPINRAALEAERDALRIQAAAVAAQQSALTEEENRLRQRRSALEKQKEQLAGHLEQRRQHLVELQDQLRHDRAALNEETEAARREHEQTRQVLVQERESLRQSQHQTERTRTRLLDLRQRLKRRWHRHWDAQVASQAARASELADERERLRREAEAIRQDRATLVQAQLRFNGEAELGRRRLQEEWQQLGLAQQQWETTLNGEHARRNHERRELERRAAELVAGEKSLAARLWQDEQRLAWLGAEIRGLESRARNQREKLFDLEQELLCRSLTGTPEDLADPAVTQLPVAEQIVVPAAPWRGLHLAQVWARLAAAMADQRQHLLEQWEQLLRLHEAWQADRAGALESLESAVHLLDHRERRLAAQEQRIEATLSELGPRQQALCEVRCGLEGWQARLTAREAALEAERAALLTEVRTREEAVVAQAARLEELRNQRLRRWDGEAEASRQARAQCEEMRRDYAALWKECQERRAQLAAVQRDLNGRSRALENLRQQLLNRTADPAAATRRLERLERQQVAHLETEGKALEEERQRIAGEVQRLDALGRRLREEEEDLIAYREVRAREQTEEECRREATAAADQRRLLELQRLQTLHQADEQQLAQLREELERVARLLMDEVEPPQLTVTPTSQAA